MRFQEGSVFSNGLFPRSILAEKGEKVYPRTAGVRGKRETFPPAQTSSKVEPVRKGLLRKGTENEKV